MPKNIVIVTNIPRPYRRALFRTLAVCFADRCWTLRILYTSDPSKHVRRGAPTLALDDASIESYVGGTNLRTTYERVIAFPKGLGDALRERRPDCVVAGGFGPSAMTTAKWCRRARVPYVTWSGAWPGVCAEKDRLRALTRRWVVRGASAFIAYGTASADYLVDLGAPSSKLFYAWNTVDLEGIASSAREAAVRRSELEPKYRLAKRNLLYVGTLVESKGLTELVSAALWLAAQGRDWALHLVGAGPLRKELEARVRAAGLESYFRFHGFRPPEDVAELLGLTDGLILPTKLEAWGLVINEAMACGVPVVASSWAGATRDLIEDGVTGYVIEPGDSARLIDVMSRLVAADPQCLAMGRAGADAVRAKASLEKSAVGFVAAVECALAGEDGG